MCRGPLYLSGVMLFSASGLMVGVAHWVELGGGWEGSGVHMYICFNLYEDLGVNFSPVNINRS